MKKLISIGVALAVLALVVLPIGAAAQCEYEYGDPAVTVVPDTYAKIPFAILESGLGMVANILAALPTDLGLPTWLPDIVMAIAPWTGGPLSWTVDMMGWGLSLVGTVLCSIGGTLGLPEWIGPLVNTIACRMFTPFVCNVTTAPPFNPCLNTASCS